MRRRKGINCPAEVTLEIIGGRWKILIHREVFTGVKRFGELRRALTGITEKVLAQQLKEMERDGIIVKRVYPEIPPKAEYSLTPAGRSLQPILEAMHEWAESHARQGQARGKQT